MQDGIDINRPRDGNLAREANRCPRSRGVSRHEHVFHVGGAKGKAASSRQEPAAFFSASGAEPPLFACDGISNLVAAPRLAVRRDPALGLLHVRLQHGLGWPSARLPTNGFCQVVHRLTRVSLSLEIVSHILTGGKRLAAWVFKAETPAGMPVHVGVMQ
jgi:hypothetical protein